MKKGSKISRRAFLGGSTVAVVSAAMFPSLHLEAAEVGKDPSLQEGQYIQSLVNFRQLKHIAPYGIIEKWVTGRNAQKLVDLVLRTAHGYHAAVVGYPQSLHKTGDTHLLPEIYSQLISDAENRRAGIMEHGIDYNNYSLETQVEGVWASRDTATVIWKSKVGTHMSGDSDPNVPQIFYEIGIRATALVRDGSTWRVAIYDLPLSDDVSFGRSFNDFPGQSGEMLPQKELASKDHTTRSLDVKPDEVPNGLLAVNGTYDRARASNYAMIYGPLSGENGYRDFGNNCTNFVSQCMRAGGWHYVFGYYKSSNAWWYDGVTPPYATRTWSGSENFYWFIRNSGRGLYLGNIWDMIAGDVVQYDEDKDGFINHSQICHYRSSSGMLYMAQHSDNYAWRPLSNVLATPTARGWIYSHRLRTSY